MMETNSKENAKKVILALHGIRITPVTESDIVSSPTPSFIDVNGQMRHRLGLSPNIRVRSRSFDLSELNRNQNLPRSLSQVWSVHNYTDIGTTSLRRKRKPNSSSSINYKSSSCWCCIRAVTAIILLVMTFLASLVIHTSIDIDLDNDVSDVSDNMETVIQINTNDYQKSIFNIDSLNADLNEQVFGQRLAIDILINRLTIHFDSNQTVDGNQWTMFIIHGGTGTGKTHTARILSQHFTAASIKVHWYFPTIDRHTIRLVDWFASKLTWTSQSSSAVFVLDDFDAISEAHQLEQCVYYLKSSTTLTVRPIFVVTFTEDSQFLESVLFNHLMNGHSRDDFSSHVYNWECPLLDNEMRVTYVPFLPIQSEQLEECINHVLCNSFDERESIGQIVERTDFIPEEFPVFSKYGCKRLQIVDA